MGLQKAGVCVCIFLKSLHIGSWHNLTLQMPHTTIQDMGIPATLDGEFSSPADGTRVQATWKLQKLCLMPSRTQGGDRVGHELLSVVGVVSKFGPPKSHKISLELVDYHHLHLGGVSHFEKPFWSRRSRGYTVSRFSICQVCYRHIYWGAYETGPKWAGSS